MPSADKILAKNTVLYTVISIFKLISGPWLQLNTQYINPCYDTLFPIICLSIYLIICLYSVHSTLCLPVYHNLSLQVLFFTLEPTWAQCFLKYLYSIHRAICRPSDHSVERPRAEIRTQDGRSTVVAGKLTNRPLHLQFLQSGSLSVSLSVSLSITLSVSLSV